MKVTKIHKIENYARIAIYCITCGGMGFHGEIIGVMPDINDRIVCQDCAGSGKYEVQGLRVRQLLLASECDIGEFMEWQQIGIDELKKERDLIMKRAKQITIEIADAKRRSDLKAPKTTFSEIREKKKTVSGRMHEMRLSGVKLKDIALEFGVSSVRVSQQIDWYKRKVLGIKKLET